MAGVLWCGGEDLDFYNTGGGPLPLIVTAGSSQFRTAYSRCALYNGNGSNATSCRSASFSGGAVTSCWLHFQCAVSTVFTNALFFGLGLNSANQIALAVGNSSTASKLALWKFSGGTWTSVATEAGNSLTSAVTQIDMQVQAFGSGTVTVNIYLNGSNTAALTFSGAIAVTGVTTLDCVALPGQGGSAVNFVSEIIVTDTVDTRGMSLATLPPNAAGTLNNWDAGNFSNINPVAINDASVASVNSTGKDLESAVTALVSGSFSIPAVRVAARTALPAGSTPTLLKLGVKTSGGNNVDAGHSPGPAWQTFDRLMLTNPVSAANWLQSDITTPIQIDLQSG